MDDLAGRFEAERGMLRSVAYRMLGSAAEADDAVQETWIRLERAEHGAVDNLGGWLRTVVTRICLDLLRARAARPEDPTADVPDRSTGTRISDPEDEALLADSVSRALLVVLETLTPKERVAFVLHDMFAVPFEQIAPVVDRTPDAAKKLASRARGKVRGRPSVPAAELARQHRVVTAFLAAARSGDLDAVLALLAPDVVRRADRAVLPPGMPAEVRGAREVAEGTTVFANRSRLAELALVDGRVGAVLVVRGRLRIALTFTVVGDRIAGYDVVGDPERLSRLDIGVLDEATG